MNFKDAVLPQADKFQYITNKLQRSLAAEEKDLALSDSEKFSFRQIKDLVPFKRPG